MSPSALFILIVASLCTSDAAVDLTVNGLCPAVYTPFDDDGSLNVSVVSTYAKYLMNYRIDGVLLAGTSGEGTSLSLDERKKLLDAWLKEGKARHGLKVVMQVGGQPLPDVLELAQYAEKVGADAIMTLPELYFRPASESALVRYLEIVSNAAPKLPILYYHHPNLSGVQINVPKFYREAIAKVPNFRGMKCDFVSALNVDAAGLLRDEHQLFMMGHLTMAANRLMGFNSSMTAVISIFPKLCMDIDDAIASGSIEKARQLQRELNARMAVITSLGEYVPFSKAAMEIVTGIRVGNTRDPLKVVPIEQQRELEKALKEIDAKYSAE